MRLCSAATSGQSADKSARSDLIDASWLKTELLIMGLIPTHLTFTPILYLTLPYTFL